MPKPLSCSFWWSWSPSLAFLSGVSSSAGCCFVGLRSRCRHSRAESCYLPLAKIWGALRVEADFWKGRCSAASGRTALPWNYGLIVGFLRLKDDYSEPWYRESSQDVTSKREPKDQWSFDSKSKSSYIWINRRFGRHRPLWSLRHCWLY